VLRPATGIPVSLHHLQVDTFTFWTLYLLLAKWTLELVPEDWFSARITGHGITGHAIPQTDYTPGYKLA